MAGGGNRTYGSLQMTAIAQVSLERPGEAIAGELGRSFAAFGFAIVCDHGVEPALIARAEAAMRAFFALPEAVKRRYRLAGQAGARGYTPLGTERAKGAAAHDLKEFWHVGRELPPGDPLARYMPANVWPDEGAGFRETMLELFASLDRAGRRILSAIAVALELAPDFFEPAVANGDSVLRLLHYPPYQPPDRAPVRAAAEGAIRAAPHEDINAITLLLGAEEAGLELLDRACHWRPVAPPPGALAVNIGDMLQRLTAGRLPSTTHRVVNPRGEGARRARYSMPFFLHFRPDFRIEPLFAGGEPAITAHDYLMQRLREINLT